MADVINGWTISQRDGKWQAVNSKGQVGISNLSEMVVRAWAGAQR